MAQAVPGVYQLWALFISFGIYGSMTPRGYETTRRYSDAVCGLILYSSMRFCVIGLLTESYLTSNNRYLVHALMSSVVDFD